MIDMCRTSTTYTDQHGAYLVTPDFPFSYSTGRHCSCTLQTADSDAKLALEFVHVRLRQHDPTLCHDWIDVQVVQQLQQLLLKFCLFVVHIFKNISIYFIVILSFSPACACSAACNWRSIEANIVLYISTLLGLCVCFLNGILISGVFRLCRVIILFLLFLVSWLATVEVNYYLPPCLSILRQSHSFTQGQLGH